MPIYSEVIDDESILQILQDNYHKVLLIGCGACMNESLAYKYDMPITKDLPSVPFAIACELARLAKLLTENGFIAETKFYDDIDGFFCMGDVSIDKYPVNNAESFDIILILSCSAGFVALCDKLPNSKVVKITKSLGSISYSYYDIDKRRYIVKSESKITLFC